MAGEEGTGLHAFDDLDPVSTLSALNVLPAPEEESGQITVGASEVVEVEEHAFGSGPGNGRTSAPPPPPPAARLGASSLPPPPRAAGKSSFPPPPPRGGTGRSLPPPPTLRRPEPEVLAKAPPEPDEAEGLDGDEDTRVVPNAFAHDPEFAPTAAFARPPGQDDAFEAFDDAATAATAQPGAGGAASGPARTGIDDAELLELSATTVATNIDMDWDEEEVETKLRDDAAAGDGNGEASGARHSPFPGGSAGFAGNPSPFGPPRSSLPMQSDWEDEDEAMTKVMPSSLSVPPAYAAASADAELHGLDSPASTGRPRWLDTLVGGEGVDRSFAHNRMAWIGLGVVLLLITLLTRSMMAGREPATVTLVTKPVDAQVLVDGKPLTGQSSPFTAQGLKPNVDHTLEVRKDGFAAEKHRFRVSPGEVKPLPTVELAAQRVDTGFTLASLPSGASVSVDGRKLDQVTPVRIADLAQGLHVVRLEYGTAYQPWETQVALATGQVIELPTARLAPAASSSVAVTPVGGGSVSRPTVTDNGARHSEVAKSESSGGGSSGSSHHHSSTHERIASAPAPQPMARPMPVAPIAAAPGFGGGFGAAPMAGGGGSQGSLRVNSRPWSQVIVDGRMVGNTPQLNIPLPPGHHKVKLVNPQLGMSKGFAVDIKAGKVATKVVDLE